MINCLSCQALNEIFGNIKGKSIRNNKIFVNIQSTNYLLVLQTVILISGGFFVSKSAKRNIKGINLTLIAKIHMNHIHIFRKNGCSQTFL